MDKDLYAYGIDLKDGEQPDVILMVSEDVEMIDTDLIIKCLNEQYKDQIKKQTDGKETK